MRGRARPGARLLVRLPVGPPARIVGGMHPERGTSRFPVDVLVRSLAIGTAAGSRASLGVAPPLLTSSATGRGATVAKVVAGLGIVGELLGDKLPGAGSRLEPPGPATRMASGAIGALVLARRAEVGVLLPVLLGAAGGAAGTWGGAAWRAAWVGKGPDWPAAVTEDAVALSLAAFAVQR